MVFYLSKKKVSDVGLRAGLEWTVLFFPAQYLRSPLPVDSPSNGSSIISWRERVPSGVLRPRLVTCELGDHEQSDICALCSPICTMKLVARRRK